VVGHRHHRCVLLEFGSSSCIAQQGTVAGAFRIDVFGLDWHRLRRKPAPRSDRVTTMSTVASMRDLKEAPVVVPAAPPRERRPHIIRSGNRARNPAAVVIGLDSATGLQTARVLARHGVPVTGIAADPRHPCCRTRTCREIDSPTLAGLHLSMSFCRWRIGWVKRGGTLSLRI
jgi:hypothetical protein